MRIVKRVIAVVIVVLAIIGLLLAFGGIVGTWIVNNRITDVTVNVLTAVETVADRSTETIDNVDTRLDKAQTSVAEVEADVTAMGQNFEENTLILDAIDQRLGLDLVGGVERAVETIDAIVATAEAIESTIEAVNSIPFVDVESFLPEDGYLTQLSDGLTQLQTDVAETRTAIQDRKSEIADGAVGVVTQRTSRLDEIFTEVRTFLTDLTGQISLFKEDVSLWRERLPLYYDLAAIVITLMILFVGLAMFSLLLHAWTFVIDPDRPIRSILPRKTKGEMSGEDEPMDSITSEELDLPAAGEETFLEEGHIQEPGEEPEEVMPTTTEEMELDDSIGEEE